MTALPPIEILDTTLRDGEQMQDVSYTPGEKLAIAKVLLEDVKVDHVELTSALVSEGERGAVREVIAWAQEHGRADAIEVLGFTDMHRSVDWITELGCTVMNLLAKGSLLHVTTQLGKQPAEHFADIGATVEYASDHGVRCNIYLEDWSGGMLDSPDYVLAMLDELSNMDLWRIMLPDTLGLLSPPQVSRFVGSLVRRYPRLRFDFHGHDDYGMANREYPGGRGSGRLLCALHHQRHGRTRRQHPVGRGGGRDPRLPRAPHERRRDQADYRL